MEKPLCPLCGERHFAREPHVDHHGSGALQPVQKAREEVGVVESKPKFDRTVYQREYMRKWRARRKVL